MGFYEDMLASGAIVETPEEIEKKRQKMLPRATARVSQGGALTNNVQPGEANIRRALELYGQEDDYSQAQQYAKQRANEGQGAMLNALAAQYAGEGFEPVQAQYLKRAMAAQEPIRVGSAMISPDGTVLRDPAASRQREADKLLQLGQFEMGLDDRRQGRADNAALRMALANSAGFGAGSSPQIGSTPTGAPIFRNNKGGYLFTYDESGQPAAYAGQVMPKATSAQPSEDERKAAGWYAQADNARRNMLSIAGVDPSAANPTWKETVAGWTPFVGDAWANNLRPENRQKFVQAASSMAEALLRAATGAGINESEARQKVSELVPALGDQPGTIQQKLNSYDIYMASLRARAGRALPQLESAINEIYQRQQAADGSAGNSSAPISLPWPPPR